MATVFYVLGLVKHDGDKTSFLKVTLQAKNRANLRASDENVFFFQVSNHVDGFVGVLSVSYFIVLDRAGKETKRFMKRFR